MPTYLLISKCFYFISVLFALISVVLAVINTKNSIRYLEIICVIFIILLYFTLCIRPISGYNSFPDSKMYANWFLYSKEHGFVKKIKDVGFDIFTSFVGRFGGLRFFFVLITTIHFFLLFYIGKLLSKTYYYILIILSLTNIYGLILVTSLLRQEIAILLVILSFFFNNKYHKYLLLIIGVMFHKSVLLLFFSIVVVDFVKIRTNYLLVFWVFSTIISYLLKGSYLNVFDYFLFDERFHYITEQDINSNFFTVKLFRWDYWIFSFLFINIIWYLSSIKKLSSVIALNTANVYILSNTLWIWLMFSNHTYRFALLSWSLIPIFLSAFIVKNKGINKELIFSCFFFMFSILNLILFIKREGHEIL